MPDPAATMLLSFALPGAGQHVLGQRRKWVYLAFEVLGWSFYVERRGAGADFRDQYRDLAWNQARIQSGTRIDASFTYYETLTNWTRSGAFDQEPITSGLQPEVDPTTFNGSIWDLATRIFLPGGTGVPESGPLVSARLGVLHGQGICDRVPLGLDDDRRSSTGVQSTDHRE